MKKQILTLVCLIAGAYIIQSCSRGTIVPASPSSVGGLTSVSSTWDSATTTGSATAHVLWNITGGAVLTATGTPLSLGTVQLIFSGSNITTINTTDGDFTSMNIAYNSSNQIDTITMYNDSSGGEESIKYAFQYSGTHITKVIEAIRPTIDSGYGWIYPNTYYFVYSGANIAEINASINYQSYGHDTGVYKFFPGTHTNNFATYLPTYFLLFSTEQHKEDILTCMPLYLNPVLLDSMQVNPGTTNGFSVTYNYLFDTSVRVKRMVEVNHAPPFITSDTTNYNY